MYLGYVCTYIHKYIINTLTYTHTYIYHVSYICIHTPTYMHKNKMLKDAMNRNFQEIQEGVYVRAWSDERDGRIM